MMVMTSSRTTRSPGLARWSSGGGTGPAIRQRVFRRFACSGGLAALWIRDAGAAVESQPVVFLGSEGELKVVARDLGDYLWLLANGVGPLETVDGVHRVPAAIPELVAVARRYTGGAPRSVETLLAAADAELRALTSLVESSIR